MLLYSLLHLFGYGDLKKEDLMQFRQWGSLTPGHPEYRHTVGVEATTGPLGAGMGMALVAVTNHSFGFIKKGEDGLLSGLTNTFRQAGSSSGVAILNAVFMAFILTPAVGMTVGQVLMPGFKHAFFVAALMSMIAFVLAMSLKQKVEE